MLPVGGEPLLAHTLRHLAAHGITDVAVNLHTHADQFTAHFGDGAAHERAPAAGGLGRGERELVTLAEVARVGVDALRARRLHART
jgi:NDP-sugar pyrophosphorylase family protein